MRPMSRGNNVKRCDTSCTSAIKSLHWCKVDDAINFLKIMFSDELSLSNFFKIISNSSLGKSMFV